MQKSRSTDQEYINRISSSSDIHDILLDLYKTKQDQKTAFPSYKGTNKSGNNQQTSLNKRKSLWKECCETRPHREWN